jgi:hypothetical protein
VYALDPVFVTPAHEFCASAGKAKAADAVAAGGGNPAMPASCGLLLRRATWMAALVGLIAGCLLLAAAPALAHPWGPPATAVVAVEGSEVAIEWRAEFDDAVALGVALGLLHPTAINWDWDGLSTDDRAMVGDALSQAPALHAYLLESIQVRQDGAMCEGAVHLDEDFLSSGARVVYRCPHRIDAVSVRITMLHALHEDYRTFAHARGEARPRQQVFTATDPEHRWTFGASDSTAPESVQLWPTFVTYLREGIWHIWLGIDHILFLISLLLPAVLRRQGDRWQPAEGLAQAFLSTVKVVTAFTLAHSITLTLAVLGVIQLPSRLVESAIAGSVIIAALNNVRPLITRRLWLVAFGFGLIHGLGFASVLADLGLPRSALALSLFSFNLGVELGQLAIVAAFFPIAYGLRATRAYAPVAVPFGSLLIALLAGLWLLERAFGLA